LEKPLNGHISTTVQPTPIATNFGKMTAIPSTQL